MSDNGDDPLRERIVERLEALRRDASLGERQLAALDARATELRAMLLRIAGATQVLEETLSGGPSLEMASSFERTSAGGSR